ncbi:MAG: RNase H family protein [Bacteroidia bacterium]
MYRNEGIEIDVDGAYRAEGEIGYGLVIRRDGNGVYIEGGIVPRSDSGLQLHRQVGGEIYAVVQALRWCYRHKVEACTIYYDYAGLAQWAEGKWRARTPLTQRYVNFLQRIPIVIKWVKVPAHAGWYWNELADALARGAWRRLG